MAQGVLCEAMDGRHSNKTTLPAFPKRGKVDGVSRSVPSVPKAAGRGAYYDVNVLESLRPAERLRKNAGEYFPVAFRDFRMVLVFVVGGVSSRPDST